MKATIASIIFAVIIIGGAIFFGKSSEPKNIPVEVEKENVSIIDGIQVVEIQAKGGYSPQKSVAQAGIPTILKVQTEGTFDCSSSIRIPGMNITKNLPYSGTTDIDLGIQEKGIFKGTCGMGMYQFEIEFK